MAQAGISLDDAASELFQQLGGIDKQSRIIEPPPVEDDHMEEAQAEQDAQRLALIDLAHHFSAYFVDAHFLAGIRTRRDPFEGLTGSLDQVAKINGRGGDFLIRFRGHPTGTSLPAESDYVILYDDLIVDGASAATLFSRMGVKMSHLSGRLAKAFKVFSTHGISTLHLSVPAPGVPNRKDILGRMRTCLDVISRFNSARKTESAIKFEMDGRSQSIVPVTDERDRPDLNLTLVAVLNRMPPPKMADLVRKVATWMRTAEEKKGGHRFYSVYDAFFGLAKLRDQLIQPPIDVNNVKWLAVDKGQTAHSRSASKDSARVARLVMDRYGGSSREGAQVIQSVYGDDYESIEAPNMGTRLRHASDFLTGLSKSGADVEREVLRNLKGRFEQVDDAVFDNLIIQKNVLQVRDRDRITSVGAINGKLKGMIQFYKGRSETRKKMSDLAGRKKIDFDARDYKTIARDFGITVRAAENLIELLKTCFDENGHFLRKVFERHIPELARHERKVFRFLWHYLKETPYRHDRVAFLNSLQLLIAKMKASKDTIRMLLADVLKAQKAIQFSDRNAFMLMNILLRTYNREMDLDIERTPEEVLRVKNGLNPEAIQFAAGAVDRNGDAFLTKVRTIHGALLGALEAPDGEIPPKFLFLLERELYIFLSLVGGRTAQAVMRSALKEYGNPDSDIYRCSHCRELAELSLQQLTVIIRGFGRISRRGDLPFFRKVREQEPHFLSLSDGPLHTNKVRRIMQWIDQSSQDLAPVQARKQSPGRMPPPRRASMQAARPAG